MTVNYVVTFSEAVTGFSSSGMTVGGTAFGTATPTVTITPLSSGTSGTTYDVAVTGMVEDGTIIASVAADAATDTAGNQSEPSANAPTVNYLTAPTVTIAPSTSGQTATNRSPIDFTVTFSEPVTGFTGSGVTISGTAFESAGTATVTAIANAVSGVKDGTTYQVAVSGMTTNGSVVLTVPANAAHDSSSDGNLAATGSIAYNTTGPTVTVAPATSGQTATNSSIVNFTVTFSEAVTNFANGDVTLSGTADPSSAVVSGTHPVTVGSATYYTTYNVAVSGMTQNGTVTMTVAAGKADNAAGNPNKAATTPATVTYETTAPTATIALAGGQQVTTHDLTVNYVVTFSEPVTGFGSSGMTVGGTAFGTATPTVTVTGQQRRQRHDLRRGRHGDGQEWHDRRFGRLGRGHGCGGQQSTPSGNAPTVTLDTTVPTVTIVPVPSQSTSAGSTIRFTATFSEAVTDFTTRESDRLSGTAGAATAGGQGHVSGERHELQRSPSAA